MLPISIIPDPTAKVMLPPPLVQFLAKSDKAESRHLASLDKVRRVIMMMMIMTMITGDSGSSSCGPGAYTRLPQESAQDRI